MPSFAVTAVVSLYAHSLYIGVLLSLYLLLFFLAIRLVTLPTIRVFYTYIYIYCFLQLLRFVNALTASYS
jgi:hypothetical protein